MHDLTVAPNLTVTLAGALFGLYCESVLILVSQLISGDSTHESVPSRG